MSHNKKAFLLGFVFTALSFFGVAEAAPELSVGTASGAPSEQVTIPVNLTSNSTVTALQFDIQYNPSQLSTADPVPGSSIAGIYTVHSSEPSAGLRRILVVPPESNPVIGSGLLLNIPFTINPTANYQSEALTITNVVMSNSSANSIAATALSSGTVTIVRAPIDDLYARAKSETLYLQWTPISGSTGYNIYRSTTQGGPYTLLASNHQCDYCAYADYGLINDTTYYYVVTWTSESIESVYSNEANATPRSRIRRR